MPVTLISALPCSFPYRHNELSVVPSSSGMNCGKQIIGLRVYISTDGTGALYLCVGWSDAFGRRV
jgi:hypothetical protein